MQPGSLTKKFIRILEVLLDLTLSVSSVLTSLLRSFFMNQHEFEILLHVNVELVDFLFLTQPKTEINN